MTLFKKFQIFKLILEPTAYCLSLGSENLFAFLLVPCSIFIVNFFLKLLHLKLFSFIHWTT